MSDDTKTRIRLFCCVSLVTMITTFILTDTKQDFGWVRAAYTILMVAGLLSTFIFRTHKESK